MRVAALSSLVVLSAATTAVLGFGEFAHRTIAALAWSRLLPATRQRICALMPANMTFGQLAEWADTVKHQRGYEWTQPHHFADFADDPPRRCLARRTAIAQPNVVDSAINCTRALLGWRSFEGLAFAVHFVMDLHHPLHLTSRARGGNTAKLRTSERKSNKKWSGSITLHHLLDSYIYHRIVRDRFSGSPPRFVRYLQITLGREREAGECPLSPSPARISACIWKWALQANRHNCRWVWQLPPDGRADSYIAAHRQHAVVLLLQTARRTAQLLNYLLSSGA